MMRRVRFTTDEGWERVIRGEGVPEPVEVVLSRDYAGTEVLARCTLPAGETSADVNPPVTLTAGTYYLRYSALPPHSVYIQNACVVDKLLRL